ncbi:phage tail tape measure protein [Streptomyces sp. NPDC048523]|uniref:phage tail tape measure protein n=1 Tax=Streptomyces sp. NPDC048523 TaxID=3365567 RepID=UPI00371740FB
MPVEVGVGYVSIVPEMSRFGPELDRQMSRQEGRLQTSVTRPMTQAGGDAGAGAGTGILGGIGGKLKAGMLGVAAAGAALFTKGFADAMEQEKAGDKLAAQLGLSEKESARLGKISGSVYAKGYGESVEDVNDALKSLAQNGVAAVNAPKKDLAALSKSALNLAETFDAGVTESARAAGQMIRTGLAKDGKQAFDLITRGFQTGADKGEDLLDTLNEYSTQFRDLGLTGSQSIGLLTQGLKAGARDSDTVADALKEFAIRAKDGSKTTAQGFEAIGLSADQMATTFAKGGPAAGKALDTVLDRLRKIPDPVKRSQVAVQLFGTKAEDLQQSLYSLDPSKAEDALGKVGGAADRMGNTLHDNAASKIEAFKRGAMQKLVTFIGGYVLPPLEKAGSVVTRVVAPAFGKVSDVAGRLFSSFEDSGAVSAVTSALSTAGSEVRDTLGPAFSTFGGTVTGTLLPALSGLWSVVSGRLVPALGGALGASLSVTSGLLSKVGAILVGTVWPAAMRVYSALGTALGPIISSVSSFIQQRAVPAAQMLGTKLGELVDRAQPVISVVATVASWLGVMAAKVVGFVVPVLLNLVGPVFSAVFSVLGTAIGWLSAVVGAVVSFGRGVATVATAVGAGFMWLWQNAVSPALSGIRTAVSVAWSIIGPILEVGAAVVRKVFGLAFSWAYNNAIRPAMSGISGAVSAAGAGVMAVLRPIGSFLRSTLGPAFSWLYRNAIQPAMSAASSVIGSIWRGGIKPVFAALRSGVGTIGGSFATARDAVAKSWKGIESAAKTPVNFVLGTVWNDGLLRAWNSIAGWVGLDKHKLKKVKLLAKGGTLGPEPGIYNSPTAIVGEGNPAHPEYVIPTDPRYRKRALALHAAAGTQLMADGGVLGTLKGWGSSAVDTVVGGAKAIGGAIKSAADFLTDPSKAMSAIFRPILSKLGGISGGVFGKAIGAVPKMAVDGIKSLVSKFLDFGGGSGDVGGSGVKRWTSVVLQALKMVGQPASLLPTVLRRMNQESGGNPRAINNWDINAKNGDPSRGLMQTIGSTFNAYAGSLRSRGIYDPLANVYASMRYALARYGSLSAAYNRAGGYASGGQPKAGELAWVGEAGPELVRFKGGETVYDNRTSLGMMARLGALRGFAKGTSGAKAARKQVPGDLTAFTKSLTGSASDISKAAKALADDLRKTGKAGKSLAAQVGATSSRLQALAKRRDSVASKIETAKQAAADQKKSAGDYMSLSSLGEVSSVGDLISGMQSRQSSLKGFEAQIKAAQKKGVSQSLIQQLVAAGPDSNLAQLVSGATAGDVKKLNALAASGAKLSTSYGNYMSDAMYDSGVAAGKGFLTGLKAQESALQKQMTKLGDVLVDSIEKRLDIHSPSRETERVGDLVGAGLVGGMVRSLPEINATAVRMAAAAIPVPVSSKQSTDTAAGLQHGQQLALVLADGTQLDAYVDTRVDAGMTGARSRSRAGVKRR